MSRPDDIVCFEAGSGGANEAWSAARGSLRTDDWDALHKLETDRVVSLKLSGDQIIVTGRDRVGLVLLPSGRRLVIRSKVPALQLLEWLAYLGEFPPLEDWLPDPGVATGDDLHTCLARLLLYELEELTRLHLRKDYTPVAVSEGTIRGRILATRLSRSLHRLPLIPQSHRARTFDTSHNIVLALALDKLPVLLADAAADDRRRLARLRDLWVHIQREIPDAVTAVTEAQWACPPGYRSSLQLARLILIGAVLDPAAGLGGQAFTMNLALVWERSLRRMLDELAGQTGWQPAADSARTRYWDDSAGKDDPNRWLAADAMAERGPERWVLDAKYKPDYGNESRSDRFQMCAYAMAFDADRVTLVYPTAAGSVRARILLDTVVGTKAIRIDSVELPMAAGPDACRTELLQVCQPSLAGGQRPT